MTFPPRHRSDRMARPTAGPEAADGVPSRRVATRSVRRHDSGGGMRTSRPVGRRIPLARPDIGPRELELVTQVLQSDTLAMGPFTERFEASIAALAGRSHAVACSS